MSFLFFSQSIVLTILGGAAAVITLLYILKLRRRRVEVPFARLWQRVLVDKQTSALWRKLRRLISLLLALAIAALLALAAGDPRQSSRGADGRSIAILIDTSASMQALEGDKSRLDLARAQVREFLATTGRNDAVMIARFDSQVVPLLPFSQDEVALNRALDELKANDTRADLLQAMRFASDSLRGLPNPVLFVVTDAAFGAPLVASEVPKDVPMYVKQVGESKRNVGISSFNARRQLFDRLSYELYLELRNFGDTAEEVDVRLYLGDRPFDVQRVLVAPGTTVRRFYTPDVIGVDSEEGKLRAELRLPDGSTDLFPADDVAYALVPKRQKVRVLLASDQENFFLEGAFYSEGETLEVERATCAEATEEKAKPYQIVLFSQCAPLWAKTVDGNFLYLDPPDTEGSPWKRASQEALLPSFQKIASKHPLVRWIAFVDTTILRARPFVGVKPENAVINIAQGPVLVAERIGARKQLGLALNLAETDIPLRVAFPIFIQNVLGYFMDDDTNYLATYFTGKTWYIPLSGAATKAELRQPDGTVRAVPVYDHKAVCSGTQRGFYELTALGEKRQIAVNLADEVESQITPPKELGIPGAIASLPPGGDTLVKQELWGMLLLVALLLLIFEWWTYHRRWTV